VTLSPPGSVSQGVQVRDGAEVVVKMINNAGGVLGRPLELVVEDTQGIPEKARAAVEKLITRDKVVAVTGEHQSSAALAGIEVAHRYNVPYVNTNGWSDVIREKGYPQVFNFGNFNSRVAIAAAETIAALGAKNVLAFPENTDYGVGLAKLAPNSGRVLLDGNSIEGLAPAELARRGVMRMFQLTRVFPRMSVIDNLMVAGCALGLLQSEAEERAWQVVEDLSLTHVAALDWPGTGKGTNSGPPWPVLVKVRSPLAHASKADRHSLY